MSNIFRKSKAGTQVSSWQQSSNTITPNQQTSFILPHGLILRQTINAGTTSVTIPAGITWVYAICVGGGGSTGSSFVSCPGAGAGGIAWGWTLATSSCVVGFGGAVVTYPNDGNRGGYTRYGHIIAGGGAQGNTASSGGVAGVLGSGASGSAGGNQSGGTGGTNYWGIPGGLSGAVASVGGNGSGGGGGGGLLSANPSFGGKGGDGISGGGGGHCGGFNNALGGNGGSGIIGGGGGSAQAGTGITNTQGGTGGNGINILTGAVTTGATLAPASGFGGYSSGGAGGGCAGNASGVNGGLGGGGGGHQGTGGDGILYLFY